MPNLRGTGLQNGTYFRPVQRGFTLIEILMAVGLGSLILASGSRFAMDRVDDIKDQATAQYQKSVTIAAERYLKDNLSSVAAGLVVNGAPAAIPLSVLRATNYLSAGIVAVNPYRQTPCVIVRRLPDRSTGESRLEALVTTEGGLSIPERRVPFVAAQGGSYGGFVPAATPTSAQGAYGVWSTPLAPFNTTSCTGSPVTANHLAYALYFDGASEGNVNPDDLLHRNVVAGRPDLNTMNTTLNMGGFDVLNARNIAANMDITANNDITAQGNVKGALVMATSDDPVAYGQTELRRWGLNNIKGITIQPGAGQALILQSQGGVGSGTLAGTFGRNELTYGHTQFSRDWAMEFPGADRGTIGVAEATAWTGKRASINFHNGGAAEGVLELAGTSGQGVNGRRLRAYDNQGERMGIEATGDLTVGGAMTVGGTSMRRGRDTIHVEDWAYVARNGAGVDNAQPQWAQGSAYLNDIYIRSIGKWASQLGGAINNYTVVDGPNVCSGGVSRAYCPAGTKLVTGGYYLTSFTSDMNAPDQSLPEPWNNAWVIQANGSGGCHVARAMCGW